MADYHVIFENFLRNSRAERSVELQGRTAIIADLRSKPGGKAEAALATGNVLLLVSATSLTCLSSDGDILWSRIKAQDSEIVVKGNQVFYQNESFFLNCVTLDNKEVMRNLPMPGSIGKLSPVRLLVPREKDFLLSVQIYARGDYPPVYRLDLSTYGSPACEWGQKFEGAMVLPPLLHERGNQVVLAAEGIRVFDVATGEQAGTFGFPVPKVVNWSAGSGGMLFLAGEQEDRSVLVALDSKGTVKWRWSAPEGDRWRAAQPPILGSDGEVCVLTEEAAWAVKDGKLLWKYAGGRPGFGCSLADGTFLITSGTQLVHLDSAGNRKLSVELGETPATPPSLDDQGHVFVATESKLYRID
jgi:hypothetical protein